MGIHCPITTLSVMEGLWNQRRILMESVQWLNRERKGRSAADEITVAEAYDYVNMVRRDCQKHQLKRETNATEFAYVANGRYSKSQIFEQAARLNFRDLPIMQTAIDTAGKNMHDGL